MQLLSLTLADAAANVALDDALLEEADAAHHPREVLRLWEPATPLVVVGRSSHIAREVHIDACRKRGIPILRRGSGGLSVLSGPGCLMYAVVLSYQLRPTWRGVDAAHKQVTATLLRALSPLVPGIALRGSSDLTIGDRKVSGNSLRIKRTHFLYHGTLLYDFPLELIGECLCQPPREPAYRQGRSHADFVANMPVDASTLRTALISAWQSTGLPNDDWPRDRVEEIVAQRDAHEDWRLQH